MGRKTKSNRRVHHRARKAENAGRYTPPRDLAMGGYGIIWLCDDPACLEGIHHPGQPTKEAPPERGTPAAANDGRSSDSSDRDSEGAPGGQATD